MKCRWSWDPAKTSGTVQDSFLTAISSRSQPEVWWIHFDTTSLVKDIVCNHRIDPIDKSSEGTRNLWNRRIASNRYLRMKWIVNFLALTLLAITLSWQAEDTGQNQVPNYQGLLSLESDNEITDFKEEEMEISMISTGWKVLMSPIRLFKGFHLDLFGNAAHQFAVHIICF